MTDICAHSDLCRVHELIDAQHNLRRWLLEIARLSEQQSCIPADRADALLIILDRKQRVLRQIAEINAPALFSDAACCLRDSNGDPDVRHARERLQAESTTNLRLWEQVVESEGRAHTHCAQCLRDLGARLSAGQQRQSLQRTYGGRTTGAASPPRVLDHLR